MAVHVAEDAITARREIEPEVAHAAGRARLERADLGLAELFLVDRDPVAAQRQRLAGEPDDDQLVLVRPIVADGERDRAGGDATGRLDLEVVLDDGSSRAALVAADLLGLERSEVLRIRELVAARTGIPAEAVMLACTHTHQGPSSIHYSACRWRSRATARP